MATIFFGSISYSIDVLLFCLNQRSSTPNELVRRHRAIWAIRAFQVGLSASLIWSKMEIFGSYQKGTGAESNAMATSKWVSVCFLPGIHY